MYLIKNRLVSSLFLLFPLCILFAQQQLDKEVKDYKELVLNGSISYLPIYPENNVAEVSFDVVNDKNDVMSYHQKELMNNWNTSTFNPFLKEKLTYPIPLNFKDQKFSSPVDRKIIITSRYGWRRRRPHHGIDIDLEIGEHVKTILDGKVRYAGYHGGHGKTVVVRHYNGLETVYAHLSSYLVKQNDEVKKGQAIGKGGITGNSRGSHLHLEVRYHGKSINPEYLFEFDDSTNVLSDSLFVTRKWMTPRFHKSTRKSTIVITKTIEEIDKLKTEEKKIYTVQKGDTLYRIAYKYGLGVSEICKINAIQKNSVLKIGQEIIIN